MIALWRMEENRNTRILHFYWMVHEVQDKKLFQHAFGLFFLTCIFVLMAEWTVGPYTVQTEGNHGYDNEYQDMRPFFVAFGPSFQEGISVDTFEIVDIYSLMCHLKGIRPAPNNGSMTTVSKLLRHYSDDQLDASRSSHCGMGYDHLYNSEVDVKCRNHYSDRDQSPISIKNTDQE